MMPFPDEAIDVRVELQLGGDWVDIKALGHVYTRDPITITRGRPDEGSQADPSSCTLTLNNRDGRYSPRNPLSPYYGLLGRNTPLRVTTPGQAVYLNVPGATGDRVTCPDAPGLAVTDLDVRAELTAPAWSRGEVVTRYQPTGDNRAWSLLVADARLLSLMWSPDGTIGARQVTYSTEPLDVDVVHAAIRATLDVNNGAGGWTVTFYTAPSMAGPWTQLGAPVTGSGVTSVFDGTAGVEIGDAAGLTDPPLPARYHAVQVRNGIDGPPVVDVVATDETGGATSFTDRVGNVWTLQGATSLVDRDVRFVGEVPSWPVRWGPSGRDVHVPLEAAGILRRLGQGAKPLRSALYRSIMSVSPYAAYWPLEDAPGSVNGAPAYPSKSLLFGRGEVDFSGQPSGGTAGGVSFGDTGQMSGSVAGGGASWVIAFWFDLPADMGTDAISPVVRWRTPGSPRAVDWSIYTGQNAGGVLILEAGDDANNIVTTGSGTTDIRGRGPVQVVVAGSQVGSNVSATVYVDSNIEFAPPSWDGDAVTPIATVGINTNLFQPPSFSGSVSHLIVDSWARLSEIRAHTPAGRGYTGETAAKRIQRLCGEEGIPVTVIGDVAASEAMGPQQPVTILDLLAEAADADGGTLDEQREAIGLRYRPRLADYNTGVSLALDYHDQVAHPLEPVDDDQAVRNDVTVERRGGSSARAVQTTGPLSIQAPPLGVGLYDEAVTLNLADDSTLADQAGWRLLLGTVDEARWPVVRVKLHKHPDLVGQATMLDARSHIRLTGLPPWLPPDDVDLLVAGYTEVIEPLRWSVEYNTVPQSPWRVGILDDRVLGRADTDGSRLAAAATATAATLSVAVTAGPLWTVDPAEFPFNIRVGGEVMTVTAISGASSPQTFTVIRSVNGVVKAQAALTDVRLAQPMVLGL